MSPEWPRVPYVGVGCIVMYEGHVLLVRNSAGRWSTPGGHLDFGESPAGAAARETAEETGVAIQNVEFVAITNDILREREKHYVTIWMRGETADPAILIRDSEEIEDAGWFDPAALPEPRHAFFENLLAGHTLPPSPNNLDLIGTRCSEFAARDMRAAIRPAAPASAPATPRHGPAGHWP
jgi:8-oxo-dGTP diphosphatase